MNDETENERCEFNIKQLIIKSENRAERGIKKKKKLSPVY